MRTTRKIITVVSIAFALALLVGCSAGGDILETGGPPPGERNDGPSAVSSGAQFEQAPAPSDLSR